MSEEDIAGMMSDQIAEQVAAMAAANPGLSAEEVNAMIMGAVADSSAMLADQLEMMGEEGMSEEEMAAMMQQAIGQAVDEAVMMAMPEEAEEEMMMEPGMSGAARWNAECCHFGPSPTRWELGQAATCLRGRGGA